MAAYWMDGLREFSWLKDYPNYNWSKLFNG